MFRADLEKLESLSFVNEEISLINAGHADCIFVGNPWLNVVPYSHFDPELL